MDTTKDTKKKYNKKIFEDKTIGMDDTYLFEEIFSLGSKRTKLQAFQAFINRFEHIHEPDQIYNFIEKFHSVIDDENNQFLTLLQEFILTSPNNTQKRAQRILKISDLFYKFLLNEETEYSMLIVLNILTNRNMISNFLLDLVIDGISSTKESKYTYQRFEIILNSLNQKYPITLKEIGKIERKIRSIFNMNLYITDIISKIQEKLYDQKTYTQDDLLDFISFSNPDDLEHYSENLWKIALKNIDQAHLIKKLIESLSNSCENNKLNYLIVIREIIKHNIHITSKIMDQDTLEIFYTLSNHDSEDIAYISLYILSNFFDCHTRKNRV